MLEKQNAPLQFRGGVDTKTDAKTVLPGKLLVLENATFDNPGRLNKRNGYGALARDVENADATEARAADVPSALSSGRGLVVYKDELLAFDDRHVYSRSASSDSWVWKGVMPSCRVGRDPVAGASQSASEPDAAQHPSGMQAFVWLNDDAIRYSIVDSTTGQKIVASRVLVSGADLDHPSVIVVGNNFAFYYVNASNDLRIGLLPVSEPTGAITFSDLLSYSSGSEDSLDATSPAYDVCAMSGGVYVAFNNDSAAGGSTLKRYATTSPTTLLGTVTWAESSGSIHLFEDLFVAGPVVVHTNSQSTFSVRFRAYAGSIVDGAGDPSLLAFGLLDSTTGNPFTEVTGASRSADERDLVFFWSTRNNVDPSLSYTRTAGVSGAYQVSATGLVLGVPWCDVTSEATDFLRSVLVAADAFVHEGVAYVPLLHQGSTERTLFVADDDRNIVAKALVGTAGTAAEIGRSGVFAVDDSTFGFAALDEPFTDGVNGVTDDPVFGVSAVTVSLHDPERSYQTAEISDVLHVGGGIVWMYDGVSPVEVGFHTRVSAEVTADAGTGFTYSYVVVPEWVDARGFRHFGAPSEAAELVTGAAVDSSNPASVTASTIRLTAKRSDTSPSVARQPIVLGVYRTQNNGTEYRRVGEVENETASDTVGFSDEMTDEDLAAQPTLYTTGDVIENGPPPAATLVTTHRNRMFVIEDERPLTLWYTKAAGPGAPASFSPFFTTQIDPTGGDVTAIASMDDKLVVFKRSSILAVTGQGPDDLGQQNDLSDAVLVTTDCGCVNPRSIVLSPAGLVFQSAKGFRLLSRSLSVVDIGYDVNAYKDDRVTGGALCEGVSQIRLTLDSGKALVFDYEAKQWSVFTPVRAVDAAVWLGSFCYLRDDGTVLREEAGRFDDDGSHIRMRLKTAWMQFAQMQGFQRIYKMLVLGTFESAHRLRVRLAYDFNPTPEQVIDVEPANTSTYGTGVYGTGVYGGEFPLYQWRVNPSRQKCQAMQVTLEDLLDRDEGPGESMTLTGITFELGLKRGLNKLGADNIAG